MHVGWRQGEAPDYGGRTVSDPAAVTPADVAVTLANVALATGNVEKVKEAEFVPAGTRTLAGIESTDGALVPRRTVTPPIGATALRYTVPVPLPMWALTERLIGAAKGVTSTTGVITSRPKLPLRTTDAVEGPRVTVALTLVEVLPAGIMVLTGRLTTDGFEL